MQTLNHGNDDTEPHVQNGVDLLTVANSCTCFPKTDSNGYYNFVGQLVLSMRFSCLV